MRLLKFGTLVAFLTLTNQACIAATPLLEWLSKPSDQLLVKPGNTIFLFYSLRNNTNNRFPLSYGFSSPYASLAQVGNTCANTIGPKQSCQFAVQYRAPNTNGDESLRVNIHYQGRAALSHLVRVNVDAKLPCRLLNKAAYQTAFCQSQYQKVLQYTPNVFNNENQNVREEQTLGAVFGLFQNTGLGEQICYVSCGRRALNGLPPDENTVFELASVTKTFTGSVLGKLLENGTIASTFDEIRNYPKPAGINFKPNEETVSFQQLASFSAGVCFSDAPSVNQKSNDQALNQAKFISDMNQLNPDPNSGRCSNGRANVKPVYATPPYLPTRNFYSNSSVGLLGQSLMRIDGFADVLEPDFNNWICRNILNPLEMDHSSACLPDTAHNGSCAAASSNCSDTSQWANAEYASGYHIFQARYQLGDPFPFLPWAPAGGIRSSAADMVKFIRANLGFNTGRHNPEQAELIRGMLLAHQPNIYSPGGSKPNIGSQNPLRGGQGYAWVCMPVAGKAERICGKIGGHSNFRSFLGLNKSKNYGLIILFNTGALNTNGSLNEDEKPPSIGQIGSNLLEHVD